MPQFKLWNDHIRIWCDFGTGVNRKATFISSIYERLGKALCLAFPFASRVGLAIRQCCRQTYCEMEHNCYDGLISCFKSPLGDGGGRVVVCTV